VLVLSGEVLARYGLGLGDPPLYVSDSKIEYMLKPNQDLYRFGNHYIVNQYGMRSKQFEPKKDNEIRVLLFGDSVLNGGSLTDHNELATTLLENRLNEIYNEYVVVGNVSAGSWGPGNWLTYADKYGFFDADIVILVISSHDYIDNPTFDQLGVNQPIEQPISALLEGVNRYFLPRYFSPTPAEKNKKEHNSLNQRKEALGNLRQFLKKAKNNSDSVMVFQHWERVETVNNSVMIGNKLIGEICADVDVPVVSMGPAFKKAMHNNKQPYRDAIHPSTLGQRLIFETILKNLPDLGQKDTH